MKYGLLNVDINKVCPSIEEKSHHKNVAVDGFYGKVASYARENVRCFFCRRRGSPDVEYI